MKLNVTIDVPKLDDGLRFYCGAFGFVEKARPVEGYAILDCDGVQIALMEKAEGTQPAPGCDDVRRYDRHWTPVHIDFHVADFERVLTEVVLAGAKAERVFEGGEHPPVAFCSDPFGNGFCVIGKTGRE